MLCDGSGVMEDDYSYAEQYLVNGVNDIDNWGVTSMTGVNKIRYLNGLYVRAGYTGKIAYTSDLSGSWTDVTSLSSINVFDIAYGNGYWVIVSTNQSCYYATSLSGTWTSITPSTTHYTNTSVLYTGIKFLNGYFVLCGYYRATTSSTTYYPSICYATTPTGTWTQKTVGASATSATCIYDIEYGGGYWVVVGANGNLRYSTAITGTFSANEQGSNNINVVKYANGVFVIGTTAGIYYYTTSPAGTWSTGNVGVGTTIYNFDYADGNWLYAGSSYYLGITDDLSGTWTNGKNPGATNTIIVIAITVSGYTRVAVHVQPTSIGSSTTSYLYWFPLFRLPDPSINDIDAYMKIK